MDFFKSILSDDPERPVSESDPDSPGGASSPNDADDGWSFGGFIKSISVQSEAVIETYRKDLQEFGSGLKKETEMLRETASRAVKDLPASLEAAQGAIDVVLKSTASVINKEALGFSSDSESETPGTNRSLNSGRYSRFEAQLSAIQSDFNTFCVEPEEAEDYGKWKLGFELGDYRDEIDGLIGENGILEGVYTKAVPNSVDQATFWCRYFYRVYKLKQQESVRASLVKRAISNDDDEELSWDVDDDDDSVSDNAMAINGDKGNVAASREKISVYEREGKSVTDKGNVAASREKISVDEREGKSVTVDQVERDEKVNFQESTFKDGNDEKKVKSQESVKDGNDEKVVMEEKVVLSNQQAEEVGWDEIGDVGSGDEKKMPTASGGGSTSKDDLRKRLAVEDDDEDLNWDIEDYDEPVKALQIREVLQ